MSRPLLELRVQRKRYGQGAQSRLILSDISLRLAAGEVLSLVGASGCGKSTLLRIVAGLERDYEGQVLLDGQPLRGSSPEIGYVFQEPRLFPWLSVARNVGFDVGQGYDAARVSALLAEVGLAGHEDRLPKQLSGGQAQRVAIARALYTRPRLLLLDEPFSAVDAFTRIKLQDLIVRLAQAHGSSLLLVTHDVDEAVLLSDRVLVMEAAPGRVVREVPVSAAPSGATRSRDHPDLAAARQQVLDSLRLVSAL